MEYELTLRNDLAFLLDQVKQLEPLIYAANSGKPRAYFEKLLPLGFWEEIVGWVLTHHSE